MSYIHNIFHVAIYNVTLLILIKFNPVVIENTHNKKTHPNENLLQPFTAMHFSDLHIFIFLLLYNVITLHYMTTYLFYFFFYMIKMLWIFYHLIHNFLYFTWSCLFIIIVTLVYGAWINLLFFIAFHISLWSSLLWFILQLLQV